MIGILLEIGLLFLRIGLAYCEALISAIVPPRRKNITGEVVLITGAGHGIGRCLALEFAKVGAKLVLWDINQEGNEETAAEIRTIGVSVNTYTVDVTQKDEIYNAAAKVQREVGNVDILVNNAGILHGIELLRLSDEQIERIIAVNTMAHFWTIRTFLPNMIQRNHGHIVTIASMAAKQGVARLVDYTASKYAVAGLTEALSDEIRDMKKTGIKTTTVCPFFVDTGMTKYPNQRFPKLNPLLEPEQVAMEAVDGVLRNKVEIIIPSNLKLSLSLKNPLVPRKVGQLVMDFFDVGIAAQDSEPNKDKDI
ncbi:17-beta-hydroxysteroid dehydrogenase 13-like [Saccoglossus kowalevskii]|uniref:17-beta-hydroxysteroid dehydrogenase 13-like n=1 Tax=Saccoglossus kowalevskii TaxID=10224 RepID=A0ABM0GL52_SACKO|nr:PREDICTED: 17-beta-hydroxysteroid dehydrogenase 13-like [Saccoglossus kowalevskii]